tara:strand:- start:23 stop:946 length:924 start_codon:yes stop_codon:yes gene_type:complete
MVEEKLIPLDTSGNDVEVTLKEEVNESEVGADESNIRVIPVETKEEEVKETTENKDELEEYSTGVKKRIDKLTRKMRESERREQAAVEYAKNVQEENSKLKTRSSETDKLYVSDLSARIESQIDAAKTNLKNSITNGDVEGQVDYQREIASLTQEEDRVGREKRRLEKIKPVSMRPESLPSPPPQAPPDKRAIEWADKNSWFGEDQIMTYAAYGVHQQLTEQEGFDPRSDEYYEEIDLRLKKEFPHRFKESKIGDNSSNLKPVQAVASANRSTKVGRRTVRLTPSQVAISKKLGVPLEEYAKYVKEA